MATGLADAVVKGGAEIRYDAPVTRILRGADGSVSGVELGGAERLAADVVVCNADLPVAYRTLLGGVDAPRAARRGRYSPSCLLWVAGVRGRPPVDAAHHNIHFGRQWDESFDAIIRDGRTMADPSILVTLHSRDDATLAPAGCSTLYALEPVPNLDGHVDWTRQREPADGPPAGPGRGGGLPRRRRHRGGLRPAGLGGAGHGAGHAVRPRPHVPPDGTVPAAQRRSRACRAWCSSARRRCPASACRWCWCRGSWPPAASGRWRGRDRHAGGELRRVPPAQPPPRHDLLLVDRGAAHRQAAPRACPVRVLPPRRRHRRRPRAGAGGGPRRGAAGVR